MWRLYDFPLSRLLPPSFLLLLGLSSSSASPVLWLSTHAVQLTVPIGDDGQQMSGGWPVLWLSTHAVQLTVPIGDDGQLMSFPLLWLLWLARPMT